MKLALILFALFPAVLLAQSDSIHVTHAPIVDARANEPVRITSMHLPFRLSPVAGRHEVSINRHIGNTWNPSGVLEYPEPTEPYPNNPWEANYHPPYEQMPHRYQLYSADGVLQRTTASYTYKTSVANELYTTLSINKLVGGGGWIDLPVSDRTIERLHDLVGQDDPFRRFENDLDRAEMKFTDRLGRTFEVSPTERFLGSWDVGYRHFATLVSTQNLLWTSTTAMQAGVPLNDAREHLAIGALLGTVFTKQFTWRYGITLAIGCVAQHDKLLRIKPKQYDPDYADWITGYRLMLSQNITLSNHRQLTIGIEMQGATAPLNRSVRVTAPYLNPEDIGVQTNYKPEYWTEERKINLTNQRRAARSLIRGSEYLLLHIAYRAGAARTAPVIAVYLQEDWTVVYDTGNKTFPLFNESNNAQDLGFGIKITKPICVTR